MKALAAPLAPLALALSAYGAEDAVGDARAAGADPILFGQSAAFSGPAQDLGINMRLGIEAAFQEANAEGGVHGRELGLVSMDDGYEPERAIANTSELIESSSVFALIGAVGTPTSNAAVPVAASAGVPYVAPFTGAAFLRERPGRGDFVVNLRASYDDETEAMVAHLLADLNIERIAVMYQDDSFGRAGHSGVIKALSKRDMAPVAVGVYERNTTAVKTGLLDVRAGDPGAVIVIGAYEPVAALIAWSRHIGFDPVFITISFVGSNALARELGGKGEGVFVTQVVPFPTGFHPVVEAYAEALKARASDAEPSFVSLEGYLAGRLAVAALRDCAEVERSCLLEGLRRETEIDLDSFQLRYGPGDNQGSDQVFLTVIDRDGRYQPIASLQDATQ